MSDVPTPAAWYQRVRYRVEAIQYLPHAGCAMFEQFVDDTEDIEPCDEIGSDEWILDDGTTVSPGDWVAKVGDGEFRVYSDEEFREQFIFEGLS